MVSKGSVGLYGMAGSRWGIFEWFMLGGGFLAKETHGGKDGGMGRRVRECEGGSDLSSESFVWLMSAVCGVWSVE